MDMIQVGIAFDVRDVSVGSKVAVDALTKIESKAKKAQDALAGRQMGVFGKQFERVGLAAERAAIKQHGAFASSWNKIGIAAERARVKQERDFDRSVRRQMSLVDRAQEKMQASSFGAGVSQGFGLDRLTKAAFFGSLMASAAVGIVDGFVSGAKMAVDTIVSGVRMAFKEAANEQVLRVNERNVLGVQGGAAFRQDVNRFEGLTPFDDSQLRPMMMNLRRAGLSQGASRQVLGTSLDLGGNDAGAVGGLLEQFKGIYTRRGVSKKQLINMLGDVGTTIPDFYKALGKQLKTSAKGAEKLAEQGGIDPQLIMNMITSAVNKRQGGIAGTGGLRVSQTAAVRWEKLQQLPGQYFKNLVESPAFDRANEAMGQLLAKLDPDSPEGQRIMGSIERMFDKIVDFIGDPTDAADKLSESIEGAVDFAEELVDDFRSWADALLPSLETIEDMVFAARKLKAIVGNDQMGLISVNMDQAKADQRRNSRVFEKQLRDDDPQMMQAAIAARVIKLNEMYLKTHGASGAINMPAIEKAARGDVEEQKNQLRKAAGVTINAPMNVTVHGGDPEDVKKAVGEAHSHGVQMHELAANEGG